MRLVEVVPVRRERAGFFAAIAALAAVEGKAAKDEIRSIEAAEYRERTKGACLLCRDDEGSATYRGRHWCRACGRTW